MRRGDAAKHCGVSIRTLADWQAARIVPYIRISHRVVLFKISELEKALDRFTIKAIGDSRP
jgi:DNA-binding transcriptional MerR regulator